MTGTSHTAGLSDALPQSPLGIADASIALRSLLLRFCRLYGAFYRYILIGVFWKVRFFRFFFGDMKIIRNFAAKRKIITGDYQIWQIIRNSLNVRTSSLLCRLLRSVNRSGNVRFSRNGTNFTRRWSLQKRKLLCKDESA